MESENSDKPSNEIDFHFDNLPVKQTEIGSENPDDDTRMSSKLKRVTDGVIAFIASACLARCSDAGLFLLSLRN